MQKKKRKKGGETILDQMFLKVLQSYNLKVQGYTK
jgi:hypothetical protein